MRKHFLILMLLTLLPFTAWAEVVDISGYQITLNATSAIYDYTNHLPTVTLKKTGAADVAQGDLTVVWKNSANTVVDEAVNAGTYTVTVTAKEGSTTGTLAVPTKTFTVNKKTLVLKVSNLADHKLYGFKSTDWTPDDVAAVWTVSATAGEGFIEGDGATADDLTVVANWGTDYNAGEHTFTLSANTLPNYVITLQPSSAKWYMDKKDLLIAAEDKNLTYGDEFEGSETVTYTGFIAGEDKTVLNGTLAFTTNYEVGSPVSGSPYSYMPTGLTSNNYNITFNNGNITVAKKSIATVTIDDIAAVTYNKHDLKPATISATFLNKALAKGEDKDYVLSYYSSATIDATTKAITAVSGPITDPVVNAGTYYVKIAGKNNFNGEAYKAFTINKKPLAVITKTFENNEYTGAAQTLSTGSVFTTYVTFDGLVPADPDAIPAIDADVWGDQTGSDFGKSGLLKNASTKLTLALTKSGVAATAIDVDNYTITVSGAADAFTNYAPTYVSTGLYKITQKTVTVTALPQGKNHGESHPLDAEEGVQTQGTDDTAGDYVDNWVTIDGIVAGDAIKTYPVVKRIGDETVASGLAINDDSTTPVDVTAKNYKVEYVNGDFTEGKGTISIIANSTSITYGQDEPAMTATITGLAEGELTEAIQNAVNAKVSIVEANHTDADTYHLTIASDVNTAFPAALLAKYNETINLFYESATYTVNPKALTKITANQQSLAVGDAQSALVVDGNTVTIEGALEGDEEAILGLVKLEFNTYVEKTGAGDPALEAVPGADVDGKFVKATSTYLKGIIFNTTVDLGNYTFPADAAKIVAGNLVVSAADAAFTFDIMATTTDQITNNVAKKLDAKISKNEAGKKRTLYANEWNSLVLPFDITPYAFIQAIGTYAVFDVLQTTGEAMNFKITINEIPAYTPFLVKVSETVVLSEKHFDDVVIKAIADAAVANDAYIFQGNLAMSTPVPAWLFTADSEHSSTVEFGSIDLYHNVEAGVNRPCPAFGAYIKAKSNVEAAPSIFIEEADGTVTAITGINADGVAVKAEGWYTLNGVKLQGMPTEKGIYINNGKKIVIK